MSRTSSLQADLLPTLAVDPGSRTTAVVARIGTRLVGYALVHNPEQPEATAPAWAIPASPEVGYADAVWSVVLAMGVAARLEAEQWWAERGVTFEPDNRKPWLVAVEKVNLPHFVYQGQQMSWERYAEMCGSVVAANAVAHSVAARTSHPALWVRPHGADTRWQEDPEDPEGPWGWYPAALLGGYPLERPASGWPPLDRVLAADGHASRIKDLAAAFSIASDAASDYTKRCEDEGMPLLPPSRTGVVRRMHGSMHWSLQQRAGRVIPHPVVVRGGAS